MTRSDYIHSVLDPAERAGTIKALVLALDRLRRTTPFEAIAFRGMSGALVAPPVADALGVSLLLVRKEASHSAAIVEGELDVKTYVIVDDFVSSGTTVRTIVHEVERVAPKAQCLGVMTYRRFCYSEGDRVGFDDRPALPVWCS